jgi:hypothetical protein
MGAEQLDQQIETVEVGLLKALLFRLQSPSSRSAQDRFGVPTSYRMTPTPFGGRF